MKSKFQVGETYATRSFCNYDCVYEFPVIARTEKTVTIVALGKTVRRTVYNFDGREAINPLGRYSMAPVLTADDLSA
jgi:hypothetical protein